jgi:hypothetical protein
MNNASRVQAIISGDPTRWRLLEVVRSMRLPDCWVRPTPRFADDKRQLYDNRLQAKGWLETWPHLRAARPTN